MANYLWGVTAAEVLRTSGHPLPDNPTLPTLTACSEFVDRAAARVNGEVAALTAGDPSALATADDVTYQLGRAVVLHLAAAEWLLMNQGENLEVADRLLELAQGPDGRGGELASLRRLMSQARTAQTVTAGPSTALISSTAEPRNPSKVISDKWFS